MKAIICLDDENGMLFNNRRQSKDRMVRNYILKLNTGHQLHMNLYSYKQFEEIPNDILASDDFLSEIKEGDYYFIENVDVPINTVDELIIFKWNRRYPSDKHFNVNLIEQGFSLSSADEFKGYSHEKITVLIYKRV